MMAQYLAALLLTGDLCEASGAFEEAVHALKEGASLVRCLHTVSCPGHSIPLCWCLHV